MAEEKETVTMTGGNSHPSTAVAKIVKPSIKSKTAKKKSYKASIAGGIVDPKFAQYVEELGKALKMPVWCIWQKRRESKEDQRRPELSIGREILDAFIFSKKDLPRGKPVALLIDSPGGYAKPAYHLATTLRNYCGGFFAVVPRSAKSAATLLALGADKIILGEEGELGPLDAQIFDYEREEMLSALDEVQALERLHTFSLEAFDRTIILLHERSGKKIQTLMPIIFEYVTNMMNPLLEKMDAVHYTQMSRVLSEAEEYAERLLQHKYPAVGESGSAEAISHHLASKYPEHGFRIDAKEAASFGLKTVIPSGNTSDILSKLSSYHGKITVIGRIVPDV